jgi:hypothetical protein
VIDDHDELVELFEEALDAALERFVPRIAAELALLRPAPMVERCEALVDATVVARYLRVKPQFVYANAVRLRARRLGRKTLRFSLAEIDQVLLQAAVDGLTVRSGSARR